MKGFKDKALQTQIVTDAWFLSKNPVNRVFANNICMSCLCSLCEAWEKLQSLYRKIQIFSGKSTVITGISDSRVRDNKNKLKLFPHISQWERTFLSSHFIYSMMLLVPAVFWTKTLSFVSCSCFSSLQKERNRTTGQIKQVLVNTYTSTINPLT